MQRSIENIISKPKMTRQLIVYLLIHMNSYLKISVGFRPFFTYICVMVSPTCSKSYRHAKDMYVHVCVQYVYFWPFFGHSVPG